MEKGTKLRPKSQKLIKLPKIFKLLGIHSGGLGPGFYQKTKPAPVQLSLELETVRN